MGPCSTNPCVNGGHCFELNSTEFSCTCPKNCHGEKCENCDGKYDCFIRFVIGHNQDKTTVL